MSEDISWRELACRRKEDMDGLNLQIDALHARMEASTDYSIKLQQLIENLKYPESEVPFPELHHHKMIVAAKARIRELEAAMGDIWRSGRLSEVQVIVMRVMPASSRETKGEQT